MHYISVSLPCSFASKSLAATARAEAFVHDVHMDVFKTMQAATFAYSFKLFGCGVRDVFFGMEPPY